MFLNKLLAEPNRLSCDASALRVEHVLCLPSAHSRPEVAHTLLPSEMGRSSPVLCLVGPDMTVRTHSTQPRRCCSYEEYEAVLDTTGLMLWTVGSTSVSTELLDIWHIYSNETR